MQKLATPGLHHTEFPSIRAGGLPPRMSVPSGFAYSTTNSSPKAAMNYCKAQGQCITTATQKDTFFCSRDRACMRDPVPLPAKY